MSARDTGTGVSSLGMGSLSAGRKADAARARKSFQRRPKADAGAHDSKRVNRRSRGLPVREAETAAIRYGLLVRDLVPATLEVLHVAVLPAAVPVDADANVAERIELTNFALKRLAVHSLGLTEKQLGALARPPNDAVVADLE